MKLFSIAVTSLMVSLLLALTGCHPPVPPVINDFTVAPTNQCATALVGVHWAASADDGHLTISPPTADMPTGPLISLADGGFRFHTATTDTTYTLTVHRDGLTATQSHTVTIVPNPFVMTLELPYNCADRAWELPAFSFRVYGDPITVESFTNQESQELLLEFGGQVTDLPPRVSTRILSPVRFTADRWVARLQNAVDPACDGSGSIVGGSTSLPQAVHIMVTSTCPTR